MVVIQHIHLVISDLMHLQTQIVFYLIDWAEHKDLFICFTSIHSDQICMELVYSRYMQRFQYINIMSSSTIEVVPVLYRSSFIYELKPLI